MSNTAVGAKKILYINNAHEEFFEKQMNTTKKKDVYHQALFYCLGLTRKTRSNIREIYDFENGCVKSECLSEAWQTSGSRKVVRMAINLYCNGTPSVYDYKDPSEQLEECKAYTVEELFCSSYAPFFWQAIQLRYPEYASYNFKLISLFEGED